MLDAGSPEGHLRGQGAPEDDVGSWWTPERIDLINWLEANAPALTPFYEGALSLAMSDGFPGRMHFIALAIREIRNRLPEALGTKVKSRKADYEPLVENICDQWIAEGLPADGSLSAPIESTPSASGPPRRDVAIEFLASVGQLIKAHSEAQANRRTREENAFSTLSDLEAVPPYAVKNWQRSYRDVHKFVHAAREPRSAEEDRVWVENFFKFEKDLMTFSKPSYENMDDIDKLLQRANRR